MSKYGNVRTEVAGIAFSSKREARRYQELRLYEKAGQISGLELQPRFDLSVNGVKVCTYVADFRYRTADGKTVVEDAKGVKTAVYRLKKKLMIAIYEIEVEEV